jgi:hypothetical protein
MMNEEQYIKRIEELSQALNACYTDIQAAKKIQHDPKAMLIQLVAINAIVCAALNTQ